MATERRSLKFRVWGKWEGKHLPPKMYDGDSHMFHINATTGDVYECTPDSGWGYGGGDSECHAELIPLQFISRTDDNGKEIYEGDIIRLQERIPSTNEAQRSVQGADAVMLDEVVVVVYDEEGAGFDMRNKSTCRAFGSRGEQHITVIGNIYENPELIPE